MNWIEIVQAARAGKRLTYKAPLSFRGVTFKQSDEGLAWTYRVETNGIQFYPSPNEADPFLADEGHADRITVAQ